MYASTIIIYDGYVCIYSEGDRVFYLYLLKISVLFFNA